jgi:predicted dehydrogenase
MHSVNAALLGMQHPHSSAHLNTLRALPEVKSIHVWDERQSALDGAVSADDDKVAGLYTDLDALLEHEEIAFAMVAARNDLSADLVIRTLEAGKHVLAEKPIGRDAGDTERAISVARRTDRKLGVCYQNRANPAVMDVRRLISDGLIGPLFSVEIRLLTTQVKFRDPGHWLFRAQHAGGGILSWLGCHYLDMMRYVTGDEIVSVMAETAVRSGEDIDVEDVATLSLRFRSGAVGSLQCGYVLALSGGGYHNKTGYDVYCGFNGRAGRIHWRSTGAPTHLEAESTHPDWAGAPQRAYAYELATSPAYLGVVGEQFVRDFIGSIQEDRAIPASGADALQVARVVDAAYESSRRGVRIEVALPQFSA